MAWRRLAQRCAPAAAPAALLGLGAARCEDTMQVPRTKKTPKELPEYFVPKVPYPAWDSDWDGRRRATLAPVDVLSYNNEGVLVVLLFGRSPQSLRRRQFA